MWKATATVRRIGECEGREVVLNGWLCHKRSSGKIHFIELRDGTGTIQCVVSKKEVPPAVFDLFAALTQETALSIRGTVRAEPRSPIGYEISVADLSIVGASASFPIEPKEHGVAFLMENRHLWLRSSRQHAILGIRAEIVRSIRDYFDSRGFTLVDTPIFTPNSCEGTSTLFETEYFGQKAFLAQSGQLYGEAAAMAFGRIYCFGPTFRAEKSKTRRHLTEFWMVEPECAFFDLDDDMDLAEDFVVSIVARVVERCRGELQTLERDVARLESVVKPFPRITYDEALKILASKGKEVPWGEDFGGDEETVLSEAFDRPVLVHRYPARCKAFYMKNDPARPELALCVDMIAPEGYGEIIGGGQREDDLAALERKIREAGLPPEPFGWYLDLRRYGSVPHAGFGLGVERTVAWIAGLHHVRETIPFPRLMDRLTP